MTNKEIAAKFSQLAKLMEIHGENSFRTKSYSNTAFTIEKLSQQLSNVDHDTLSSLKGIGASTASRIVEILQTGTMKALQEMQDKTPEGVKDMMAIKGLGPKKIVTIWKTMEIESVGELLYACNENRLTLFKGFGAKTQESVKQAIEYHLKHQGHFLYAEVEDWSKTFSEELEKQFPKERIALTGAISRQSLTIEKIEWVVTIQKNALLDFLHTNNISNISAGETDNTILGKTPGNISICFYCTSNEEYASTLFRYTGTAEFLAAIPEIPAGTYATEGEIFESAGLPFTPPYLREKATTITTIQKTGLPAFIDVTDIKGIIHSHSTWSDGANTLKEMTEELIRRGMEYLVISDHSRSAFYANGLAIEAVIEQHKEIDALNAAYAPFKIFKSIESDILNDGSLDYPDAVLASFDLVIASVHSNLKMDEAKAMSRLLRAIENPYTRILGHPTGRLLLSRKGYPIDHHAIIDACVAHNVVIEINAHPRRLDLDWTWIPYALEKGAMLSVNPDAHSLKGFDDIKYGTIAARKGMLTKERNLSSFTLEGMNAFVAAKKV